MHKLFSPCAPVRQFLGSSPLSLGFFAEFSCPEVSSLSSTFKVYHHHHGLIIMVFDHFLSWFLCSGREMDLLLFPTCEYLVSQHGFLNMLSSLWCVFLTLLSNIWQLQLRSLISESPLPSVYTSGFMPVPYDFCYYGSVVRFEVRFALAVQSLLCFHMSFRICCC